MIVVILAAVGTVFLAIIIWLAREVGKTGAIAEQAESDLHEAAQIMKETEDAEKTRRKAINDTIRGLTDNRLRKYYRD